jgi:hypothetical protein
VLKEDGVLYVFCVSVQGEGKGMRGWGERRGGERQEGKDRREMARGCAAEKV